jgi:hypothetical protein
MFLGAATIQQLAMIPKGAAQTVNPNTSVIASSPNAPGWPPSVASTSPAATTTLSPAVTPNTTNQVQNTSAELSLLRTEYRVLSDKLEGNVRAVDRLLLVIGIVLAVGGFTSIFGFVKSEARGSKAHTLMVAGGPGVAGADSRNSMPSL